MPRVLALSVAIVLAGTIGARGADEKIVELRISHGLPAAHPLHKALEEWGAAVDRASNGTILYTIHPAEKLGKAQAQYDLVRDGAVGAALVEPADQLARFPIMAAAALPLLMSNAKGGSAALDEWYRAYAEREIKEAKFCFALVHEPGTIHSRNRKITAPTELRGMRVRPANAMTGTFVSRLGANNVPAPEAATLQLLESGGAEAAIAAWDAASSFGPAVTYHLDAPLYVGPVMLVINKAKYAGMSQAQKTVIDDHCSTPWAVKSAAPWADAATAARKRLMRTPGHEVYALTPAQTGAWRDATASLRESWALNARKAGIDPDAAMDSLKAMLGKYQAAY